MKKGESSAVAMLVVLTIVIAPFIWVYNRWGWGGLVLSVILSVVFIVWVVDKFTKPSKKELDLIEHYFYQLFDGSYTYDDKKGIQSSLSGEYKIAFSLAMQIDDCIRLSLNSKTRDVAEERHKNIDFFYGKFLEYKGLFSDDLLEFIHFQVNDAKHLFINTLFTNLATKHYEKAQSLKTVKSKLKYAKLAIEALDEGLSHPEANNQILLKYKKDIEAYIHSLA
ncbi:hypothetical protein ACOCGT_000207 [Vibrio cholerae]|uniref:hypothetical protein n=1 Tax=Vibrio cholerae TaxID=666 RepID=UPI001255270E|nr:hypothetical protein [Vibrio cholerae]VVH21022.1 hypothetical protein VP3213_52 [Vibrio phage vB_VchM_VP-3213]GHW76605.1 hypothetical protein VCSRO154_0294 [Vibrio metoecus]EHE6947184.1 hypothetical protein [Vibrio cholerae]EJK2102311.1 hypothetical protein [Vibrio cholerae]